MQQANNQAEKFSHDFIKYNPIDILNHTILQLLKNRNLIKDFWYVNETEILTWKNKKIQETIKQIIEKNIIANETGKENSYSNIFQEFLALLEINILAIRCEKVYGYYEKVFYKYEKKY